MSTGRNFLHLNRHDLLLLFALLVLSGGMMFTLGVMVGMGAQSPHAMASVETNSVESAKADKAALKESKKPAAQRTPASTEASAGSVPGAAIKEAFQNAKQKSLVDQSLLTNTSEKPRSVADTAAHLKTNDADETRSPASEKKVVAPPPVEPAPAAKKGNVKNLFERGPSGIEAFQPRPGHFTVQVASFATEEEGVAKINKLRGEGFIEAYTQPVKLGNGETWYRVSIGSFPSPAWAKKTGDKLVRRKLASDFVIRKVN